MSNQPKRNITPKKMEVYEIGFNMAVRLLLIIAGLVAFFIILNQVINAAKEDSNKALAVYAALEGFLVYTIFVVYRHYFPTKKED